MSLALQDLPRSWSPKNRLERLVPAAAASLSRMLARAVAETGVNFTLNDAYRSKDEQIALFTANYRNRGTKRKVVDSDRMYNGTAWRHVTNVAVASPDLYGRGTGANHTKGIAIDIVPGPIQDWIKRNGSRFGWSWDEGRRNKESWHFVYVGRGDQYTAEGYLDHAAVQRAVGAAVDGKIGTGTVAKIKAFQKSKGLDVDGKVGPATKRAMGLSGKGEAAPAPSVPATPGGGASVPTPDPAPTELKIEQAGPAKNAYAARTYDGVDYSIKHVTIHWWGKPSGQTFEGIRDYLIDNPRGVSAHYVLSGERVAQILPEERGAWGNGNRRANLEGLVIECDPNKVKETIPTLVALLADIFRRRGEIDTFPHDHWTSTECPGEYRQHIPAIVAAAKSGAPIVITPTAPSKPTTGGGLPTGKDLLMKLADVPDFPLLRTPGNLCYYGGDTQQTAVSGKMPNGLAPGEIEGSGSKSGAKGLKAWQRQMNARGYNLTADGRFGGATETAAKNLQRLAGLAQDGKIGPTTWFAAWLLPVK